MRSIRDPWKVIESKYAIRHSCTQCAKTTAGASIDRWLDLSDKARGMQKPHRSFSSGRNWASQQRQVIPSAYRKLGPRPNQLSVLSPEADMPIVGTNVC